MRVEQVVSRFQVASYSSDYAEHPFPAFIHGGPSYTFRPLFAYPSVTLISKMLHFQPMPLGRKPLSFDHPEWIFELKYDGFRALAVVELGRCTLYSRNGHPFAAFADLASRIGNALMPRTAVMDGEIVCMDKHGHCQFNNLLFRRGEPCFVAFDLLHTNGNDLRREQLLDRKLELRRIIGGSMPLIYADHIEGTGTVLFEKCCELDLEGIVAKQKHAPYDPARPTWFKIRNRNYSQMVGREELFERDRHREPVPGWHSCSLACAVPDV